jgi:hypothetical protein
VDRHTPEPGTRVSIRAVTQAGALEVVGFVLTRDAEGLVVRDRHGVTHQLTWEQISALRSVGVARGRDPLRTPPDELEALVDRAGMSGRKFVIRLSQLLDGRSPVTPASAAAVRVEAEWAATSEQTEVFAAAWFAAQADARNLLVVADDPARIAELTALGFVEVD